MVSHHPPPCLSLNQGRCVSLKMLGWIYIIFLPFIGLVISTRGVKQLVVSLINCDTGLLCQNPHSFQGTYLNYNLPKTHAFLGLLGEKATQNQEKKI